MEVSLRDDLEDEDAEVNQVESLSRQMRMNKQSSSVSNLNPTSKVLFSFHIINAGVQMRSFGPMGRGYPLQETWGKARGLRDAAGLDHRTTPQDSS